MTLDRLENALAELNPDDGDIETAELVVREDVLVKLFALGPGAELDTHEHADSTNVFHIVSGTVTVIQDDGDGETEAAIDAPGVILHDRGVAHGARNETDEVVAFTASLCPLPS
ncbi:cupin domain-containing protein [Halalkalirubrum salinum]|uniref:cupin domain-containing protein n=1 Tax=Halalkalirubrum salinum TaxID=2563889 RepID=UPI0010FADB37|nr:cupin domain-containing protein [Halalkalirubrum salinum]